MPKQTILLLTLVILFSSCEKDWFSKFIKDGSGDSIVLADTSMIVNSANGVVQLTFDHVDIEIPKGAVPDGTELVISLLDETKEEEMEEFDYGPVYEITLEEHTSFSAYIKIYIDLHL